MVGGSVVYEQKPYREGAVDCMEVENAGVSSEMWVRILHTGSPRIPGEGSSALGKSGPNARPKGVVDGKQAKDSCTRIWSEGVTETDSVTLLMD